MIRLLVAGVLLSLVGCGPSYSPDEVVEGYARFLGRDPLRTLPLLSEEFHRQHGLRIVTSAEALAWRAAGEGSRSNDPARDTGGLALDRLQLAWLTRQAWPSHLNLSEKLSFTIVDVEQASGRCTVTTRVRRGTSGQPFRQVFHLSLGNGKWRIDGIQQAGVHASARAGAFVAHPTEAKRRALSEHFSRR